MMSPWSDGGVCDAGGCAVSAFAGALAAFVACVACSGVVCAATGADTARKDVPISRVDVKRMSNPPVMIRCLGDSMPETAVATEGVARLSSTFLPHLLQDCY